MRYAVLFHLLALYAFAEVPITSDFSKAKDLAQAYNRPMVLMFTGSGWCRASQKMLDEIIHQDGFKQEVNRHFIFVHIDFPQYDQRNAFIISQDQRLKEEYEVKAFPLLVMVDPEGNEMTRVGYMEMTPNDYAKHLKDLSIQYFQIKHALRKMEGQGEDIALLEKLYDKARALNCSYYQGMILEKGIVADRGVLFPLEKYATYVTCGQADCVEAVAIREKIIERDPQNEKGTRLRLALLDFQAHEKNPEEAVKPLGLYLSSFGKEDVENLHKLHLIISEYFSHHQESEKEKQYAEKCLIDCGATSNHVTQ